MLDGRTLVIADGATVDWVGGQSLALENGAAVENGGTFNVLQAESRLLGGPVTNSGTFRSAGGLAIDWLFDNSGVVRVESGTLALNGGYTQTAGTTILAGGCISCCRPLDIQDGTVTGWGPIGGSVVNQGTFAPGLTPGTFGALAVTGDYTQPVSLDAGGPYAVDEGGSIPLRGSVSPSRGALEVHLGGIQPGVTYDQLQVGGTVNLAGPLAVTLADGFVPTVGQQFVVVENAGNDPVRGCFAGLPEGVVLASSDGTARFRISYAGGDGGNDVVLTALEPDTATTEGLAYEWDLDYDGEAFQVDACGASPSFPGADGPARVTVAFRIAGGGSAAGPVTAAVTVRNVDPILTAFTVPGGGRVGAPVVLRATATDPAGPLDPLTFAWTVTAPDGTRLALSGESVAFTPEQVGEYAVALAVTDGDGGTASAAGAVSVVVPYTAPVVGPVEGPAAGVRGQPLSWTGSFTDPDVPDAWVVRVSFGDGSEATVTPGADKSFAFGHAYAAAGTYPLSVTVTDARGLSGTAGRTVAVATVAVQGPDLLVGGTAGDDHIVVTPVGNTGAVEVKLDGQSLGTFTPAGRVVVYAQGGDDDVQVAGSIAWPAWLYGGPGADRLRGGEGHDVLLGGEGDDLLVGGGGRDLLIGGTGADRILGNADDDILIAGTTDHDSNDLALALVMQEWTRTDANFQTRVAHLLGQSAGRNEAALLTDQAVHDDGAEDVLTGSSGNDWFLFNQDGDGGVRDRATDLSTFEAMYAQDLDFIFAP